METTRILWSGLTGRIGREAMEQQKEATGAEIVAGLSRLPYSNGNIAVDGITRNMEGTSTLKTRFLDTPKWYQYAELSIMGKKKPSKGDFDVMVDFSHPNVFEKVVELAVRTNVPLISGTSGLSDWQMAMLYDATNRIPVFRGGNFRFKVKKFIDEAVELAIREEGRLDLYENFYKGKSLPSETSKVLQRRIMDATGRTVEVHSADDYGYMNLICNWEFQVHRDESPTNVFMDKVCCRTIGFDELAHDVLEIAKVMAKKPVKKGEFYDLDELWDELVSWAI